MKNLLIITQKVDLDDANLAFFHEWLKEFAARVEILYVVAASVGRHELPGNVRVFSLGKEAGRGRIRRYLRFYSFLFRILPKVTSVFVHMIPAWVVMIWPFAFYSRKKVYLWYTHKSVTPSLRLAEKMTSSIFTASPESCRLVSKKVIVTGHGIDTDYFVPQVATRKQGEFKALSIGRISESKDYEFLFEAVRLTKVMNQERNFTLTIVGGPITEKDLEYERKLRNLTRTTKLDNFIDFLGPKSYRELPGIYNNHDLFLHASVTGSLDKVVLEAMSSGLRVLSTSEAFTKLLPGRYVVQPRVTERMAEKISELMKVPGKDLDLRSIVVRSHNLKRVVEIICNTLQ